MKSIKIVIRTKGLSVRTRDLSIGFNVLNYIADHGIMDYSIVHNSLLDKANKVLGHAIETLSRVAKEKVEEETPEVPIKEAQKRLDRREVPKFTKKSRIPRMDASTIEAKYILPPVNTSDKSRAWTKDELKVLRQNLNTPDRELAQLIPTRSPAAIVFKKRMLIKKAHGREKDTYQAAISSVKKKKTKSSIWTDAELEALRLNINMRPKQLQTLPWLKRKTKMQISQKKYELTNRIRLEESRKESDEN